MPVESVRLIFNRNDPERKAKDLFHEWEKLDDKADALYDKAESAYYKGDLKKESELKEKAQKWKARADAVNEKLKNLKK